MCVSYGGELCLITSVQMFWPVIYYWGCARGFGRGTLYMKWGQQNQRFGTMRLRGEKDEKNKKERKNEINEILLKIANYDKMKILCFKRNIRKVL